MLTSVRYQKGRGNSAIYARVRNASNLFYNFSTQGWDAVESSNSMVFLTERADSDPIDSLYVGDVAFPLVASVQEIVDSIEGLVIGSGVYEPALHELTLAEIEASTVLAKEATVSAIPTNPLRTNDARLDNLDAKVSLTATYTQVDSMFAPMLDALAEIVVNTGGTNADIANIADAVMGNWEIRNKQMIFYKRDGSELLRYNLFDKLGNASEHNVFKREKV